MKITVVVVTIIMSVLFLPQLSATEINPRVTSTFYTKSTHSDEKWCDKTYLTEESYQGGTIYYGCNTVGFKETVTHYKKNTSADYRAASKKDGKWYYGPTRDNNSWSKEEVILSGANGSGVELYD